MGATQILSTENQAITNYDFSKLFSTNFVTVSGNLVNGTGAILTVAIGTLIGRIAATGKLAICKSASSDGSQIPLGIVVAAETIAIAGNSDLVVATTGCVNEAKIILDGSDTLDTDFDGRILRDRIPADTAGLELVVFNELSDYDNQ